MGPGPKLPQHSLGGEVGEGAATGQENSYAAGTALGYRVS